MQLERPLLLFDIESTGVDVCLDRIVELGVTVLHPDGSVNPRGWSARFNPGIPIPAEATAVHGITDADVAALPPFSHWAPRLHQRFQGKDLATYNGNRFDIPLLDEEMRRCGLKLDLTGVRVIDAAGLFYKKEPRDLGAYIERYCKRPRVGAHGAGTDSSETLEALQAQLAEYDELAEMDLDELARYSRLNEHEPVDIAGKLYRDPEGFVCFAFGKNKDKRVADQKGYANWMFKKDFPGSTLDALEAELSRLESK